MNKRVFSARVANIQAGDMFHRITHINTFGTGATLPPKKFTPIWNPPKILKDFTGREKDLETLKDFFAQRQGTAVITSATKVSGTGGIGKTQLAAKVFHDLKESGQFQIMIWLHKDLSSEFRILAHTLGFEIKGFSDAEIVKRVYYELSQRGRVLVVMDDVDRQDYLEHYCPPSDLAVSILLTTRDATNWGANVHSHMLGVFTINESKKYIQRLFENNGIHYDEKEAERLSETVGNFPLALSQAVAFIVKRRCSISDYIERFKSKIILSLSTRFENDPYKQYVWVTVKLNIEAINNPEAIAILRTCSYLAPEAPIRKKFLTHWAADQFSCADAIHQLCSYSLLQTSSNECYIVQHQLVQDIVRTEENQDSASKALMKIEEVICRSYESGITLVEADKLEKELLPHLQVICTNKSSLQEIHINQTSLKLMIYLGNAYSAQGNYAKQIDILLPVLKFVFLVKDDTLIPQVLINLGVAYNGVGSYQAAREVLVKAVEILDSPLWKKSRGLLVALRNLGNSYIELSEYKLASIVLARALEIEEQISDRESVDLAFILSSLGVVHRRIGDKQSALRYQERALSILEREYGKEHPDVVNSLSNIANLHIDLGNVPRAIDLSNLALSQIEKVYGTEHIENAGPLFSLGSAYSERDPTLSKKYYIRARKILEKHYGFWHPKVAACLSNIGNLERRSGNNTAALELYKQSVEIQERYHGQNHANTEITRLNMSLIYCDEGNFNLAFQTLEKCIDVFKRTLGLEHPHTRKAILTKKKIELKQRLGTSLTQKSSSLSQGKGFFSPRKGVSKIPSPRAEDLDEILEKTLDEVEFGNDSETETPQSKLDQILDETLMDLTSEDDDIIQTDASSQPNQLSLEKILNDAVNKLDTDESIARQYGQ